MIKKLTLFVSSSLVLLANEPSAFGAGDLNAESPYGLTDTEKYIYENKKKLSSQADNLQKLKSQTKTTSTRLSDLENSIEGIKSIIDSEGKKLNSQANENTKLKTEIQKSNQAVENFDKRLKDIVATQEKIVKDNNENIDKINKVIKELGMIITGISNNYISKSQLDEAMKANQATVDNLRKELKEYHDKDIKSLKESLETNKMQNSISGKKPTDIMKDAVELYSKKEYDKAIFMFNTLIQKNHKPARSHYYLAQIEYAKKNYLDALKLYNKSVELYDKADYMPEILFNSGVCYMNLKDNKNAKNFFNALISSFPKDANVAKAKKLLSSLKDKK
jgi:TolA-binding protein